MERTMDFFERLYWKFNGSSVSPKDCYESMQQYSDLSKCKNTASPIFSNPKVKEEFFKLKKKDLSSKV